MHNSNTTPDFLGGLVHPHHASGSSGLSLLPGLVYTARGRRRRVGKPPDLHRGHRHAAVELIVFFDFDSSVQGWRMFFIGDLGERGHHVADVFRHFRQYREPGIDSTGSFRNLLPGYLHVCRVGLPASCPRRSLFRDFGDFLHRVH